MEHKILASVLGSAFTTATYTVPAGKTAIVSKIIFYCVSTGGGGDQNSVAVAVQKSGGSYTTLYKPPIGVSQTVEITGGISLGAGDTIYAQGDGDSVSANVNAVIFGVEIPV